MDQPVYDNHTFNKAVYNTQNIKGIEFQTCTFKSCDLSASTFTNNKFLDCVFEDCNLSMMKLSGSTLSNAHFKSCKLLGVIFSDCQDMLFSVAFTNCILDYSSFMRKKMQKTNFFKCSVKEVNFSLANLAGSLFEESDLSGAIFNRSDLGAADFTTARNFSIDPELNNVKKAAFSQAGLQGLLGKYGIRVV